ncbi:MAG: hypothetical protein QOD42_3646 [Sphingomonadales bacterium]|nr:hypothetical protein [Sphingomonadales bacterium]
MNKKLSPKNYLIINGTPGDDFLIGTSDPDTINGLDGNDTLIGAGGNDQLFGGLGDDVYRVETAGDDVIESVGQGFDRVYAVDNYALDPGTEIELLAFIAPDVVVEVNLTGNEFGQTIVGGAGPNAIVGGGGNDVMAGLGFDDTYRVQDAGDVVLEAVGGGNDTVFVDNSLGSYALQAGTEIEHLSAFSTASTVALALTGNEFGNRLTGTAGADTLIGGGGNDTLVGGNGGDVYRIDDLGDVIFEGFAFSGTDAVYVAMNCSDYTLPDQASIEVLAAIDPTSTVAFNLTGNFLFANTLFGNAGVNILIGGDGAAGDTLVGYGGNDIYRVENAPDNVIEAAGGGYDSVYAGTSYTLTAGQEIEVLSAIDPSLPIIMNLTGNAFSNEIYGNTGANTLDGKAGDDLLFGRGGADIFAFTVTADSGSIDTIGDFLSGTDKIGLDDSTFAGIGTPGAFNANAFVIGTAAGDADDRIIYDSATGRLFYDLDGNGIAAAYQFATLAGAPVLAASDFAVV